MLNGLQTHHKRFVLSEIRYYSFKDSGEPMVEENSNDSHDGPSAGVLVLTVILLIILFGMMGFCAFT